ncbi:MAG: bifunctional 3,4-dihydroxy-2-butanone-4-phosphate synthase/GTP cyclohydrolase II [Deltaproteobacteria bacterium CG11_big_fil_rev_8_21_14_0_20_45_16]|nr:MAG: bifunctional 3,4-dihydroxy-2-butanone-4-phosphate synthase/GTP cyclohydrolase II [Deltaproteobacteria bacterium CG11_big_fil_rev_8_21_14_0_20_45_16]
MNLSNVPELISDLRQGKMVILVDDEDRENEGDLVCAAQNITSTMINFMAMHGRGLICLSLSLEIVERLELPMMTGRNGSRFGTAFTISIEAKEGVSTGISAADRAHTILTAVHPQAKPSDLVSPGHIFPLRAASGGVLKRAGQTEGSVDLAKMAGFQGAGVICEIMNEDGSMARRPDLEKFALKHNLKIGSVAEIIRYRMQNESLVRDEGSVRMPSEYGEFNLHIFSNSLDNSQHIALVKGPIDSKRPALVRVHSECLTGDVFGSERCDCGDQLEAALQKIGQSNSGVLLYLRQEGRGIGLLNKIKAYQLQDQGMDTVQANHHLGFKDDLRDYGIGAQILRTLGVSQMDLLTNNPRKIVGLEGYGLQVHNRVPLEMPHKAENITYLRAKKERLGHILKLEQPSDSLNL